MVSDVVSWGEPRYFQHVKDMMHVVTPSSSIVQKIFLLRDQTVISNANLCDRQDSLQFMLKEIHWILQVQLHRWMIIRLYAVYDMTAALRFLTWHKRLGRDLLLYYSVGLPEHCCYV